MNEVPSVICYVTPKWCVQNHLWLAIFWERERRKFCLTFESVVFSVSVVWANLPGQGWESSQRQCDQHTYFHLTKHGWVAGNQPSPHCFQLDCTTKAKWVYIWGRLRWWLCSNNHSLPHLPVHQMQDKDWSSLLAPLHFHVPHVFLTLGGDGVFHACRESGRGRMYKATPTKLCPINVVSTSGAGDRFVLLFL